MTHNLVIQSLAPLSDTHHKPLLALSRGTRIVQTDDHALRIDNANPAQRLDIDAYCGTHALDFAFVEAGLSLGDFGPP